MYCNFVFFISVDVDDNVATPKNDKIFIIYVTGVMYNLVILYNVEVFYKMTVDKN